ncbi:MAG: GSCFA domain-containing protein [Chitinophagaceae bacterium]
MLNIELRKSHKQINHQHKILSIGSCFTEHIGKALQELKFNVLQNPNGILFDPASVSSALLSYIRNHQYKIDDLFQLNELWHSWAHHSRFSGTDKESVLQNINDSQKQAHQFLREANWLIITLGSAFNYKLTKYATTTAETSKAPPSGGWGVCNCHRAPAQWFVKHLMPIDEIIEQLEHTVQQVFNFNKKLNIIFTVSPVRHIRDGVVQNNRSKARLLETVHYMVNKYDEISYFPSYELVIDILRDYRFYAEDMVHPNYLATDYVLENFIKIFMSAETQLLNKEIEKLNIACKHRSAHPNTKAHQNFLKDNLEKVSLLQQKYPFLDLQNERSYLSTAISVT